MTRILLAGATGLVGLAVTQRALTSPRVSQLIAPTRRPLAPHPRLSNPIVDFDALPEDAAWWKADAVICALGTTIRQAGSEEAFRAVDFDLVLSLAKAAREAEVANFVLVSSAGADAHGKAFYLRVKGEIEAAVTKLKFRRLDILRPGLLRGSRPNGMRPLEILGRAASPLTDMLLHGDSRRYRSIDARTVAEAAAQCAREKPQGRWQHDNDSIHRYARRLDGHA